jgi:microsomal epoxide hydrolase
MTPTPFKISIPDSQLQALRDKLSQAHFPDELDNASWDMGVPLSEIQRLVTVWREQFDWRAQERRLNEQLNQFRVPVPVAGFGELDIHAVHHRSGNPHAVPLLFIHGCMCCI